MKKVEIFGSSPKPVSTAMQPETLPERLGVQALPDAYWVEEYSCIARFIRLKKDDLLPVVQVFAGPSGWLGRAEFVSQFAKPKKPRWLKRSGMFGHAPLPGRDEYDQGIRFDEIALAVIIFMGSFKQP